MSSNNVCKKWYFLLLILCFLGKSLSAVLTNLPKSSNPKPPAECFHKNYAKELCPYLKEFCIIDTYTSSEHTLQVNISK